MDLESFPSLKDEALLTLKYKMLLDEARQLQVNENCFTILRTYPTSSGVMFDVCVYMNKLENEFTWLPVSVGRDFSLLLGHTKGKNLAFLCVTPRDTEYHTTEVAHA